MGTLYQDFRSDKEIEAKIGIELHFGESKFMVRRAGGHNKAYQAELRKLTRPLRKRLEIDALDDIEYQTLVQRAYFRAVLLGWESVHDQNGKYMEFTEANFIKLMTDLPDLWDALMDACTKVSNFRQEEIREDGEQLGNLSSGSGNGAS